MEGRREGMKEEREEVFGRVRVGAYAAFNLIGERKKREYL